MCGGGGGGLSLEVGVGVAGGVCDADGWCECECYMRDRAHVHHLRNDGVDLRGMSPNKWVAEGLHETGTVAVAHVQFPLSPRSFVPEHVPLQFIRSDLLFSRIASKNTCDMRKMRENSPASYRLTPNQTRAFPGMIEEPANWTSSTATFFTSATLNGSSHAQVSLGPSVAD